MKYTGVIQDNRTDKEKAKDFDSREIVLGTSTGSKITEITVNYHDQMKTSSCTAHAVLSMMEYNGVLKKNVSRYPLYRKRWNYPAEGSNATDLIQKSHSSHHKDGGLISYEDITHPKTLTESWANSLEYIKGQDITVPFDYFTVKEWSDLEKKVNSGIAVTMAFKSSVAEWSKEYVEEKDKDIERVRHQITLIPKGAFYENGKLWFSVLDSSQFGKRKIRYASFDFLKNRVIVQPQFALPKNIEVPTPPATQTLSVCKLNDKGQKVTNLQAFLAEKGFLDKKYVTGFYGQLTSKAVLWFQLTYHPKFSESIPELLEYNGEYFGKQSVKVATDLM